MPELTLEKAVEEFLILVTVGATLEELTPAMVDMSKALEEREYTIDMHKVFMDQLIEAADESEWIPHGEYFMNDWIYDAAEFLRTGKGINDAR